MVQYGQTVSAKWLLLTGHKPTQLRTLYLIPLLPTLPFPTKPQPALKYTLGHINVPLYLCLYLRQLLTNF